MVFLEHFSGLCYFNYFYIVLGYTKFGNFFATGGEQNASRNMGVPVTRGI